MNHNDKKRKTIYFSISSILVTASLLPFYQFVQPWLVLHEKNIVVYDCQLRSDSVPVGSKYPGKIDEIFVKVGQRVTAGEKIARMDRKELGAEIDKANATIELAKANYKAETLAISKALATMAAQKDCLVAKSKVATSRLNAVKIETKWIEKQLARAKRLAKRGSVSKSDLEKIYREFENFRNKAQIAGEEDVVASLDLAAVKLKLEEIEARTAVLDVLKQEIAIAKSELCAVNEQQDAAMVRAQNAGVVTDVFRGAGSSVKVGDAIVVIQNDLVWCEAWVDENRLADIQVNGAATLSLKSFPDREIQGIVDSFLPAINSLERSPQRTENQFLQQNSKICVKLHLENAGDLNLVPGMTGTAVIVKHNKNVENRSSVEVASASPKTDEAILQTINR